MPAETAMRRTARACTGCNKKKIRCKFDNGSPGRSSCDSCLALAVDCVPRTRKQRTTTPAEAQARSPSNKGIFDPQRNGDAEQVLSYPRYKPGISVVTHGAAYGITADTRGVGATGLDRVQTTTSISSEGYPVNDNLSQHMHSDSQSLFDVSTRRGTIDAPTNIGRAHRIAHQAPIDDFSTRTYHATKVGAPSETISQTLQLWGSPLLPPRPVRDSLIATFLERCYPWTPLVLSDDICLFNNSDRPDLGLTSLLLSQSLFLAASRVSAAPGVARFASSAEFYARAKALFWCGHEKDPLTVIAATLLLHWYNPSSPQHFSFDTSRFWLSVGVGLAYQLGLYREPGAELGAGEVMKRRRLWWSLVVRDCLISSGQGRPRTINLKDSNVRPPNLDDFPDSKAQAQLFISYVEICVLLGDLTECRSRKYLPRSMKLYLESALFRWTRTLPDSLRLLHSPNSFDGCARTAYIFNARQLHIPYFITLAVMARSMTSYPPKQESGYTNRENISPVAIIASSFVAGIFEEFLARNELQFLGPIMAFYLLAAGITLISTRYYDTLWPIAQQDLEILQSSLQELSKRWPSATSAWKALQNMIERVSVTEGSTVSNRSAPEMDQLTAEEQLYFQDLPSDMCRLWILRGKTSNDQNLAVNQRQINNQITEFATAETPRNLRHQFFAQADDVEMSPEIFREADHENDDFLLADYQYDGIGTWLLEDWDAEPS